MPAAVPIVEAAAAVFGTIETISSQSQAAKAQQTNEANQNALLNQAVTTAQNPDVTPFLNAEKGAVQTLQSNIGGAANPGAQIQALYGNGLSSALNASAQASDPVGTELTAGQQYGANATSAGNAASSLGNPLNTLAGGAFNALTRTGQPTGNTGTATGLGGGLGAPSPISNGSIDYTPGVDSGFVPSLGSG